MKTSANPKILVVTGPESSGKTALAEALSSALSAPLVPEFARYYLSHLGRPYEQHDLEAIARGQRAWKEHQQKQAGEWLVLDTDWTVLQVWEAFKYHPEKYFWPKGYGPIDLPTAYLLCAPDFPWEPDPLREHPESREELFEWYQNLLRQVPVPVWEMYGSLEERVEGVLTQVG
jgi:nicotinamide riboside kinase